MLHLLWIRQVDSNDQGAQCDSPNLRVLCGHAFLAPTNMLSEAKYNKAKSDVASATPPWPSFRATHAADCLLLLLLAADVCRLCPYPFLRLDQPALFRNILFMETRTGWVFFNGAEPVHWHWSAAADPAPQQGHEAVQVRKLNKMIRKNPLLPNRSGIGALLVLHRSSKGRDVMLP